MVLPSMAYWRTASRPAADSWRSQAHTAAPAPAAGQGLLRHGGGELADRIQRVRAAQLGDRDHHQDRLQRVADAAGLAVVGDAAQVHQQAPPASTARAVNVEGVQ